MRWRTVYNIDLGYLMKREIRHLSAQVAVIAYGRSRRNLEYSVYVQYCFYTLLYRVKQMLNGYPVPVVVPAHNFFAQPS
jgi:hypothetical protein